MGIVKRIDLRKRIDLSEVGENVGARRQCSNNNVIRRICGMDQPWAGIFLLRTHHGYNINDNKCYPIIEAVTTTTTTTINSTLPRLLFNNDSRTSPWERIALKSSIQSVFIFIYVCRVCVYIRSLLFRRCYILIH